MERFCERAEGGGFGTYVCRRGIWGTVADHSTFNSQAQIYQQVHPWLNLKEIIKPREGEAVPKLVDIGLCSTFSLQKIL